jgi:purine-binding chemotaxis protein CheW
MNESPGVQDLLDELNLMHSRNTNGPVEGPARRVLGLWLGTELYGLEINGIREITKQIPLTFVPGAPPTILGVTTLRGQILPVVDLRLVLGMEPWIPPTGENAPAQQARARIVVINQGDVVAGLLVDGVTEVYEVRGAIEPPLGTRTGVPLTEGQVQIGERMMVLLNLPNVAARLAN